MLLKDSTVIVNKNQYTDAIETAVDHVYGHLGLDAICTSGNDSKHGDNSLHYVDRALDMRFWNILDMVAQRIREQLPFYYDVVREKDHFHIEADSIKEAKWNKNS